MSKYRAYSEQYDLYSESSMTKEAAEAHIKSFHDKWIIHTEEQFIKWSNNARIGCNLRAGFLFKNLMQAR